MGRIGREEEGIQLETLPKPYWQYKELFEEGKVIALTSQRLFDQAIDLKEGVEPPWGHIYLMSAYQLNQLDSYLKEMFAQGKITDSNSPYRASILFIPKSDGSLRQCVDYRNLNKLTILNKYPLLLMDEL